VGFFKAATVLRRTSPLGVHGRELPRSLNVVRALALHQHKRPWDGLITTDSSMLNQAPELAALLRTKLTLVVATESGYNPVRARFSSKRAIARGLAAAQPAS